MNEELKQQLLKELLSIVSTAKVGVLAGINEVQKQLPDLVMQILNFNLVMAISYLVMAILLAVLAVWLFRAYKKAYDEAGQEEIAVGCFFGTFGCWILCVTIASRALQDITMITIAPKLFLIKYVTGLLTNQ